jgi:glycerate kinase
LNQNGEDVAPTGKALGEIKQAVRPSRSLPRFDVLCDVTNPLFGASGAAQVYARQKGADDAAVTRLDDGLRHLAQLVERQRLSTLSPATPGAGAAGGVGYGAVAFLNAQLHRGIEHLLDLTHFDAALNQADVVITGEGRLDAQTLQGKLIDGVCRRAQRAGKPVLALCGELHATNDELRRIGLHAAYCINDGLPTEDALQKTAERLARATERLELPSPQPSPRTGRG